MAEYSKSLGGAWVDADKIIDGSKVKIVSECEKRESNFKDKEGNAKVENVAKVRFQGDTDSKNMRINWATIYGLIDAFGTDSKLWVNHVLTARTMDAMVGDTMRTIVYLVADGFELAKNEEKKLVIRKIGGATTLSPEVLPEYPTEEQDINPDEIPFN